MLIVWTKERVEQLRQLWADGSSCGRIAMKMDCGISRNAVIGKVHRLGLPGRATRISTQQRYRSGPASYEEKERREAERLARRMVKQAERRRSRVERTRTILPPRPIVETVKPPDFLALTFNELQRESCRYPRGEGAAIRFCGQPKMQEFSYCKHCYAITHYKPHDSTPNGRTHWVGYLARAA